MQAWEPHQIRRCILPGAIAELGELRLDVGPAPHAVSGGSAMSPVTVEQPRKLDISRTEPKSGCCASRQDPCSVSPLPGPACADSVGFQEKGAL